MSSDYKQLTVSEAFYASDYQQANGEALCPRCGAVGRVRRLCVNCEGEGYTLVIREEAA